MKKKQVFRLKNAKYFGEVNKKGLPHGKGKCVYNNGKVYIGFWKNGKKNGKGTLTWPSGHKSVGSFKNFF